MRYAYLLCKAAIIVFLMMLYPNGTLYAQEELPLSDTTIRIMIDPNLNETDPQHQEDRDDMQEKEVDYFLKKSEFEGVNDTLALRTIPERLVKEMQGEEEFWYANNSVSKQKKAIPPARQQWFQTLLWVIIIGGFAGFLIWYLAGNNVGLFRKKEKPIYTGVDEEIATEDIFAINYEKEIEKASRSGNYRLATRLLFLRLLKNLSQRKIIQYKQDKTNLDYLMQLQATAYYSDFFRIARNYEYSWYGHFDVNEDAYGIIRKDFENFERKW